MTKSRKELEKRLFAHESQSEATLSEGDYETLFQDFDPEDLDFGSTYDLTSAARKGSKSSATDERDDSREHYKKGLPGRSSSKRARLPIDDEEFMGGRYAGKKISRRDLEESEDKEEDDDQELSDDEYHGSGEEQENVDSQDEEAHSTSDKGVADGLQAFYQRMEALQKETNEDPMQVIATRLKEDFERGHQVREQLAKWQDAIQIRVRLQPLLNMAQRIPEIAEWKALAAVDKDTDLLTTLGKDLEDISKSLISSLEEEDKSSFLASSTERLLIKYDREQTSTWRESLDKWNSRAGFTTEGMKGRKQFKVINQSLWNQVQVALREKDRLMARATTRRTPNASMTGSTPPLYDDGEFFNVLVRLWVDSGASDAQDIVLVASGLSVRSLKQHRPGVDPRASKGRKLRYDVQDKIVNFMVPEPDHTLWSDEKIDAFFTSIFGNEINQQS